MSTLSAAGREELERQANALIGDEVVLSLHSGDPGPDLADNVVTSQTVTRATFADGGQVQFVAPSPAVYCVSVRPNSTPAAAFLLNLDAYGRTNKHLGQDDAITLGSFPHLTVQSVAPDEW